MTRPASISPELDTRIKRYIRNGKGPYDHETWPTLSAVTSAHFVMEGTVSIDDQSALNYIDELSYEAIPHPDDSDLGEPD